MLGKIGRSVVVGVSSLAMTAVATPAHAAPYATGTFSYSQNGVDVCTETYVNTTVGTTTCRVSLTVGAFSIVVIHTDGTCTGVANAVMTITSPSTPNAPKPAGTFSVSHGVGTFSGAATDGLLVAFGEVFVTGSQCKPETLDVLDSVSGKYELHT